MIFPLVVSTNTWYITLINHSYWLKLLCIIDFLPPYTVCARLIVLGAYIRTISWLTWVKTHYIHACLVRDWIHLNCSIFLSRVASDSALQSRWVHIGQNSSIFYWFLVFFELIPIDSGPQKTSKVLRIRFRIKKHFFKKIQNLKSK